MEETFKNIAGYEGIYQVSNLGRVKSLERLSSIGRSLPEKILKPGKVKKGYLIVVLCKESKTKTFNLHQLVAQSFLNHTPSGHDVVIDHIDNDKSNNRVDNLQLTTNRHNSSKDKDKNKTTSKYTGVCWDKSVNKWRADIKINGKQKYLGLFTCEYSAHLVYQEALKQL